MIMFFDQDQKNTEYGGLGLLGAVSSLPLCVYLVVTK